MATTPPTTLPHRPELFPHEAPADYLPRLAWENGFTNALEFSKVTGIKLSTNVKMAETDVSKFSELVAVSKVDLQRFTIGSDAIIPFGMAKVKRSQLQTTGVRYCPMCMRSDVASGTPYIRATWRWRMIARCPEHCCLLEVNRANVASLVDFKPLAHAPCQQPPVSSVSSDRYFTDRLCKASGTSFIDSIPAYVAAELCTVIGHLASSMQDRPFKERIPDGFENPALRQLGFEIVANGRDKLSLFLETFIDFASKRVKSPLDMFGSVLYWASINKHNADYGSVFQYLQEVAEENVPIAPGEAFIWPIKKRKVLTIATASIEYQLSEKRVLRALASRFNDGELPRFLKRKDVHAQLLEEASYVTTSEAAQSLGCSIELCDALIKRGHLTVFSNNEESTRVFRLVHKVEIEAFLRELNRCVDRSIPTDGLVAAPELLQMRAYRAIDLFEYVLEKAIVKISAKRDAARFEDLYFDIAEVRSVFKSRGPTKSSNELLGVEAAGRHLGVKKSAIDQLVADDVINAHITTAGARDTIKIALADIDAFAIDHVSVSELVRQTGAEASEIASTLTEIGVAPSVKSRFIMDRFYRRSEIPETLFP